MASVRLKLNQQAVRTVERMALKLPVEMRQKAMMRACRKGAYVMQREAVRTAPVGVDPTGGRIKEWQDAIAAGGAKAAPPLKQSIKRFGVQGKKESEVKGVVKTVGFANTYAQSVEYGHAMKLNFPSQTKGKVYGRVKQVKFFRTAADTKEADINKTVIEEMKKQMRKLTAGKGRQIG